jgi:eukaryotic-like serine/threonine-protein kinase
MSDFVTFGEYALLDKLGVGGVAEFWRARRLSELYSAERDLGLKRLLPDQSDEVKDLFRAEAKVASALDHPSLVKVRAQGEIEGRVYLEMELIEGTSVAGLMMAQDSGQLTLPPKLAGYVAREVSAALAYVHARGLIHRDVSPPNVLASARGEVKLTDFGVAARPGRAERGTPLGKAGYMPPEQLAGGPAHPRWDVFATGVLLWEMLSGKRLFHGLSPDEIAEKTRAGVAPPRREGAGAFDAVLARALAADPAARYPSAAELKDELDRALGGDAGLAVELGALVAEHFPPACSLAFRQPPSSADDLMAAVAAAPELLPTGSESTVPGFPTPTPPAPPPAPPPPSIGIAVHSPNSASGAHRRLPRLTPNGLNDPTPLAGTPMPAELSGGEAPKNPALTLGPAGVGVAPTAPAQFRFELPSDPANHPEPELRPIRIDPAHKDEDDDDEYETRPMFDAPDQGANWLLWIGAAILLLFVIGAGVWMLVRNGQ